MRQITIILVILVITSESSSWGQKWRLNRYEAHVGIGFANVFGDIGGSADKNSLFGLKDIRLSDIGSSFYLGFRYKTTESTAVKLNIIYANAKGDDAGSINAARMFRYKTSLFETSVQYEYYFISNSKRSKGGLFNRRGLINDYIRFEAYGFGGVGGVYAMPKFSYYGAAPSTATHDVNNNPNFTPLIPIGLGIKIGISKQSAIGFEFGRRFVFGDYLDGLSTSFSLHNDMYYFGVLNYIYKLETNRRGVPLIFARKSQY